ncbi:sarcosine oxidase subunit gamma [Fodinicurvata sediminis]|uniref:sarcosine oxidase subunit gamma n=1 Tax=Fodinicurvata sediminis TaxID=1121832 RepID=UPI0003B4BE5F|nr:sarcosine oxidase subunit gamma family protein [Fodinicurvata sediminis]
MSKASKINTVRGPVQLEVMEPVARFSLRVGKQGRQQLGQALGLELPERIGMRSSQGGREALCLGPDEWVVLAPEAEREALFTAALEAYAEVPHSLAEISDREITLRLEGERATDLLTIACPRNLELMPPGSGRRTVMGGIQVVLWRDGQDAYRLDVWRSFFDYIHSLLETGNREFAAEAQLESQSA